jgi:hypothetical protein
MSYLRKLQEWGARQEVGEAGSAPSGEELGSWAWT